jgi:hypothetical protein
VTGHALVRVVILSSQAFSQLSVEI